jgi:hypothetical protein
MKKLLTLVLILSLALSGCITLKSWFCNNEAVINKIIVGAQGTIATIQYMFPGMIPDEYQAIINTANSVITQGEAYLAAGCPTDSQVTSLESSHAQVNSELKMAGVKTLKALRKP